ncbi:MAG: formimidoylglutamase [Aestuariibaculum sp.]
MDKLILFNNTLQNALLNKREGESKFGEHIQTLPHISNIYEQLKNLDVKYVIIGLPEDIGVYANHGKTGTSKAWNITLKSLLNVQSNKYTQANKVLILGYLDFSEECLEISNLPSNKKKSIHKARKIVSQIDKQVTYLVYQIVSAGKIPIIIGGGHNNAYGNIKGTSLAIKSPLNAVNFDAHSDFRTEEGRHSGNGFSYAYAEGFLSRYFIFGLHRNYTSERLFASFKKLKNIKYNTFEALEITKELGFKKELKRAMEHVSELPFGIEIDCDAIENIPSSATTSCGFTTKQARQFVHFFGQHEKVAYLHIAEAAPNKKNAKSVGKLISYLITDFINANG